MLEGYGLLIAVIIGMILDGVIRRRCRKAEAVVEASPEEQVIEAKLASIALGERDGIEALVRIASSRATPDGPRAHAIRMLSERADDAILGAVLATAFRGCGRETCLEILAQAERFSDPTKLEQAAIDLLEGSEDEGVRSAAIRALALVGGAASLSILRKTPGEEAARARRRIEEKLAPRGALSTSPAPDGELSIADEPER